MRARRGASLRRDLRPLRERARAQPRGAGAQRRARLKLPSGGVQLFHRVALERVARAILAALQFAPPGFWACNVVDPYDRDYAGLARKVGELVGVDWEPVDVPFAATDHQWQTRHPVLASDERLRTVLGVRADEPDPDEALAVAVDWLRADVEANRA